MFLRQSADWRSVTGTIIKSSSICVNGSHSSIELSVAAGEECIKKAGIGKEDVDWLLYSGVYCDENIQEPAVAPLIQKKLGLNNDPMHRGSMNHMTFSFDVHNGSCGFLSAVCAADAALRSKDVANVLIVSADGHPSRQYHPEFPFSNIGSAVLLTYSKDERRGFKNYMFKTSDNSKLGYTSLFDVNNSTRERENIHFNIDEDYREQLHAFAVGSLREYIKLYPLGLSEVDYWITSHPFKGFGKEVADAVGLNTRYKMVDLYERYGSPHTSTLPLYYNHVSDEGLLKGKKQLFFFSAGAGFSSVCALYVV